MVAMMRWCWSLFLFPSNPKHSTEWVREDGWYYFGTHGSITKAIQSPILPQDEVGSAVLVFFWACRSSPTIFGAGVKNDAAAVSMTTEAHTQHTTDPGSEPTPQTTTTATTVPTGKALSILFCRRTSNATLGSHPKVIRLSYVLF